jgi:hypothetical protein
VIADNMIAWVKKSGDTIIEVAQNGAIFCHVKIIKI